MYGLVVESVSSNKTSIKSQRAVVSRQIMFGLQLYGFLCCWCRF